jgi:hypothetical protein
LSGFNAMPQDDRDARHPPRRGLGGTDRGPLLACRRMTADEFLAAFAAEIGVSVPEGPQFDELLAVASVAAHGSERLAAPLACWMGGVSGLPADELLAAARRVAPAPAPPDAA